MEEAKREGASDAQRCCNELRHETEGRCSAVRQPPYAIGRQANDGGGSIGKAAARGKRSARVASSIRVGLEDRLMHRRDLVLHWKMGPGQDADPANDTRRKAGRTAQAAPATNCCGAVESPPAGALPTRGRRLGFLALLLQGSGRFWR